ncbi:MAG: hypothetical protein ACRDWS_00825 [Acidimicrobiia bacterium]
MSTDFWLVSPRVRGTLIVAGAVSLVTSVTGLVLGLLLVESVSTDLGDSVGWSQTALQAVEETLSLIQGVSAEVDDGLVLAADSISAASAGVEEASGQLEDVADFLDGELKANIEAVHGSMPAAIQAAGAIDATLSALSLLGVDYDPDEPFDVSLMAVEEALADLPAQLSAQAEAIRALVPVSRQFADDGETLARSFDSLGTELSSSQEFVDSYRATLAQAQEVVDQTGSSMRASVWLIRLALVMMALAGAGLSIGLIVLGRALGTYAGVPPVVSGVGRSPGD